MKKFLLLPCVALAFLACSKSEKAQNTLNLEQNLSFNIVKFVTNNEEFTPSLNQEVPTLTLNKEQLFGYSGCNRFFASLLQKDDKISLSNGGATKMMCDPSLMNFEHNLLSNLQGSFEFKSENDLDVLSNDKIKIYLKKL